jgi:DNA-directed RNA polymerase subunit RPC12/RpoP
MDVPMSVKCSKCGSNEVLSWADEATAICPECCAKTEDGHEFEYVRGDRWYACEHCGLNASEEWVADRAQDD